MAGTRAGLSPSEDLVRETIARHELLGPRSKVLVAYSGGPDSTALLHLLRTLGYEVVAGHVNHGMNPAADDHERHCVLQAAAMGASIRVTRVHVEPPTEAAARDARYEALESMADEGGADAIATGHTLDDQAETVAMRLERGGFGLGMPARRGRIVRPMIDLRREEAKAICARTGLRFVTDQSNTDERFTRNRIRRELREKGEEHLLGLVELGHRNAESVIDMDREVEAIFSDIAVERDDLLVLDTAPFEHLPETTMRAVLRRAMTSLGLEPTAPSLARALDVAAHGGRASLGSDIHLWNEDELLVLGAWPERRELPILTLSVPGRLDSSEWGWSFNAGPPRSALEHRMPTRGRAPGDVFDADLLEDGLIVRQWRPGDRMAPLGLSGSKKLQDLFTDLKIPRRERDRVPVIESRGEIVWVVPYRIAEPFKVTPATRRVATITATKGA